MDNLKVRVLMDRRKEKRLNKIDFPGFYIEKAIPERWDGFFRNCIIVLWTVAVTVQTPYRHSSSIYCFIIRNAPELLPEIRCRKYIPAGASFKSITVWNASAVTSKVRVCT